MAKTTAKTFICNDMPKRSFQHFENLRRRKELCDVTIRVGDKSISGHRVVLAAVIPYFRNAFCNRNDEKRDEGLSIPVIEPDALVCLIEYAYKCEITINTKNVNSLLAAACHLEVREVQEACSDFLCDTLEPENSLSIRTLASSLGCSMLLKKTDCYIRKHFDVVSQTTDFLNCDVSYLKELIEYDVLRVNGERQVMDAIIRWAKECPEKRKTELPELLVKVRMTLMDPLYLTEIIDDEIATGPSARFSGLLDEVRTYNLLPQTRINFSLQIQPRPKTRTDNIYKFIGQKVYRVQYFDVLRKEWITKESHSFHSNNGSTVELNGKIYYFEWGDTLQFNSISNAYQYLSDIPTPRIWTAAVTFKDKIYVCGGTQGGYVASKAFECFDPEKDEWTKTSLMPTGRWGLGVVTLREHIYTMGGQDNRSVYDSTDRYDPERKEWKCMSSMLTKRCSFGAATLDEKIYICGGITRSTSKIHLIKTAEVYDPSDDQWAFIAPMNTVRCEFTLLTWHEKLYAIGGRNSNSKLVHDFEVYDLQKDEWVCGPSTDSDYGISGAVVVPLTTH